MLRFTCPVFRIVAPLQCSKLRPPGRWHEVPDEVASCRIVPMKLSFFATPHQSTASTAIPSGSIVALLTAVRNPGGLNCRAAALTACIALFRPLPPPGLLPPPAAAGLQNPFRQPPPPLSFLSQAGSGFRSPQGEALSAGCQFVDDYKVAQSLFRN